MMPNASDVLGFGLASPITAGGGERPIEFLEET